MGDRCTSVHYWSRMMCQLNTGHGGAHVAEAGFLNGYYLWLDGPSGLGCNQRPANPADVARVTP